MKRPRAHAVVILSLGVLLAAGAALSASASGCVFRSAEDCNQNLGYGCTSGTTGSGAGGMGTGGTAGTSGGGTGGQPVECMTAATCPQNVPDGPCASLGKATCIKGKCGISYTAGPAPSQKYGSCMKTMCDATGGTMDVVDDSNKYDDGNPCTQETCINGVSGEMDLTGQTCAFGASVGSCVASPDPYNPGLVVCSECDPSPTPNPAVPPCTGGAICVKGVCVPPHCKNGMKDFGEADIDCGGATSGCPKCTAGKVCTNGPTDCWSNLCMNGKCTAPTCMDGVQNGSETAADCGSLCGQLCAEGLPCVIPGDCQSTVCLPSGTPGMPNKCAAPSCMDGVLNGDEQGVDCGGTSCPPCGK
jgi:hypothetical protein